MATEKTFSFQEFPQVFQNGPLIVYELLSAFESPEMSLALIKLNGINQLVRNLDTEALYMVIAGHGYFILGEGIDHEVREVKAGDCVRIPAGTAYQDVGRMAMVCMNHPAFNPNRVQFLD